MVAAGRASELGTDRYRQRHAACHTSHFRRVQRLWASSIGLGTYLGDPDEQTDARYAETIQTAVSSGINLLDTAINYRCQRSERVIGQALQRAIRDGAVARDEVILCTKGGYVPFDGQTPDDPARYLVETFLNPGIMQYDDLVAGCHCLAPRYLESQLTTSLANLGVETIDVYYLHNPEQQLEEVSREIFMSRMREAFALLEQHATAGRLQWYGTSTWNGYRANPKARDYLSLSELVGLAREVGGETHHFRVIQLPYNLAMPEAFAFQNQIVDGQSMSTLEAAQRLGLSVVVSASLLQRRLIKLPAAMTRLLPGARTDAQRAIQFVRSTPGVTAALVGMQRRAHLTENLEVAQMSELLPTQLEQLFARAPR